MKSHIRNSGCVYNAPITCTGSSWLIVVKILQQQKLFLGGLGVVIVAIALYFTSVVVTDSSNNNFVEGEHYILLPERAESAERR